MRSYTSIERVVLGDCCLMSFPHGERLTIIIADFAWRVSGFKYMIVSMNAYDVRMAVSSLPVPPFWIAKASKA
jgi:hypothetical protein